MGAAGAVAMLLPSPSIPPGEQDKTREGENPKDHAVKHGQGWERGNRVSPGQR